MVTHVLSELFRRSVGIWGLVSRELRVATQTCSVIQGSLPTSAWQEFEAAAGKSCRGSRLLATCNCVESASSADAAFGEPHGRHVSLRATGAPVAAADASQSPKKSQRLRTPASAFRASDRQRMFPCAAAKSTCQNSGTSSSQTSQHSFTSSSLAKFAGTLSGTHNALMHKNRTQKITLLRTSPP